MRLLITGGRDFDDRGLMWSTLDRLHAEHRFTLLIHGDARGAGSAADQSCPLQQALSRGTTPAQLERVGDTGGVL